MTTPSEMPSQFQPTRWSLIQQAAATDANARNRAWEEFDLLYREPLFRFIIRSGWSTDRAEDLLQSFLAKLAERDWLSEADPALGKMRTFLLCRLKGHLGDARKHDRAGKRDSGRDRPLGKTELEEVGSDETAAQDRRFDREWARTILDLTLADLEKSAAAKGKGGIFRLLKNQITSDSPEKIREAAQASGLTEGAVRMQLQRLREKFRLRLRAEVAETLLPGEDVSAEMRYLAEVMGSE